MSPLLEPVHHLALKVRAHGPALLAGAEDPHAELLAMVWGPRFDREHGLALTERQARSAHPAVTSASVLALLSQLHEAANQFDTLEPRTQQRLRKLILRHRRLPAPRMSHAPHLAD